MEKERLRKLQTRQILYCNECKKYILEETCECGAKTISTKPAKFSLTDKYSEYRLKYKNSIKSERFSENTP